MEEAITRIIERAIRAYIEAEDVLVLMPWEDEI